MLEELRDPIDAGRVRRALVTKLRHHGDVLLKAVTESIGATGAAALRS